MISVINVAVIYVINDIRPGQADIAALLGSATPSTAMISFLVLPGAQVREP